MFAPERLRLFFGITFLFVCTVTFSYDDQQADASAPAQAQAAVPSPAPMRAPLTDALELYRKGDFEGATQKYQQVLQLNPTHVSAHIAWAVMHRAVSNRHRAATV